MDRKCVQNRVTAYELHGVKRSTLTGSELHYILTAFPIQQLAQYSSVNGDRSFFTPFTVRHALCSVYPYQPRSSTAFCNIRTLPGGACIGISQPGARMKPAGHPFPFSRQALASPYTSSGVPN